MTAPRCIFCDDTGWVCEAHQDQPWTGPHACTCGGSGAPCPGLQQATRLAPPTEFHHKRVSKCHMSESVRCDHCEEEFAAEELVVLSPPTGNGELICARCVEIMLRRAIAELPREN